MKVAVTGGSGQLGTLVLRRLAADSHITEIVSLDLQPPRVASAKLTPITADVRDPEIARHLEGCDALIHLAFIVTGAPARPVFNSINVGGSRNVFEAAAKQGVPRIIYSSSIAAYGVVHGHPVPITEETPRKPQPAFAYAATKYEVEQFLDRFEQEHPEIAIARLRPSILIGTRMEHFLGDALRRGFLLDLGKTPLPIVWDEDVADAIILALKNNAHGAFNLSADDPLPIADLAKVGGLRRIKLPRPLLAAAARVTRPLAKLGIGRQTDPAWLENLNVTMIVSSAKARRELDWRPQHPKAADVIRQYRAVTDNGTDRRLTVFFSLVELASRGMELVPARHHLAAQVHLALTGPGGGDFCLRFVDGRLSITRELPRPPAVQVTMETRTFLALLAGQTDFEKAKRGRRVRIDGEVPAAMIVEGIVSRFRRQATQAGLATWPVRRMAQWFAAAA